MNKEKALLPVDQKQVTFYEDEIIAVLVETEGRREIYVPLRPICDLLGLDWSAQTRRIHRDPVLSEEAQGVAVMATPGGRQEMLSLPLDYLNGWLFGINATRVKDDVRERLLRYQHECYRVLHDAFQEGRLTSDVTFDELLGSDSPAAQAYKMAAAIMKMARQQLLLEGQLESHTGQLAEHEKRLELIEEQLGDPGRYITPDQAMQISQAVKSIAMELEKRSRRNEYGAVYGQLYRTFGITSYKQLPATRFNQAMQWLTDWYRRITGATGDELPF